MKYSLLLFALLVAAPAHADLGRDAALDAVRALVEGPVAARWQPGSAAPHRLSGFISRPYDGSPADVAAAFLGDLAPAFGFDAQELRVIGQETIAGVAAVRLEQRVDGAPVFGRTTVVTVEAGRATSVTGTPEPVRLSPRTRELSGREAITAALEAIEVAERDLAAPPVASRVVMAAGAEGRLAWRVSAVVVPLSVHLTVIVDAETGAVLLVHNDVRHG